MTSEGEAGGGVFLEANACGKPVIGSRSAGIPDYIHDGVNGYLVDPSNDDEIPQVIVRLLKDRPLARKLGLQGRQMVEQKLDWKKVGQTWVEALEAVVGGRRDFTGLTAFP